MNQLILGFKAMLRIWSDAAFAGAVGDLLKGNPAQTVEPVMTPAKPARSEALSLLAVLQREARLVDFIQEPITSYTDAQIGSAVRGIHDDCAKVFERIFSLTPLRAEPDGAKIEVPAGADSIRYRVVGNVVGEGPFRGTLVHPGWLASKCELPAWTGTGSSERVIAPCEIEIV